MASWTRWTWIWVNSGRWWWTGRPGVLRFMGSQRVGHDWATELNVWILNIVDPWTMWGLGAPTLLMLKNSFIIYNWPSIQAVYIHGFNQPHIVQHCVFIVEKLLYISVSMQFKVRLFRDQWYTAFILLLPYCYAHRRHLLAIKAPHKASGALLNLRLLCLRHWQAGASLLSQLGSLIH